MLKVSARARDIPSFLVMDVLAEAKALEQQGRPVIHMEVGEPDWPTAPHIIDAAKHALDSNLTRYTNTEGTAELRQAISERYRNRCGVEVDPERIVVTVGSSPALFLIWGSLLEPGDQVVVTDPHYACYPGSVEFMGGEAVRLALPPQEGFKVNIERLERLLTSKTRAILINSPSNPTGLIVEDGVLEQLASIDNVVVVSDEIYQEIEYGGKRARSILEFTQDAFVMDGFSKRYCMTGWRLGWVVVPEKFIRPVRKVHQNYFISASEFVQKAGVAALTGPQASLKNMVETFDKRRRTLIERLDALCFDVPAEPRGAFYVLADARKFGQNSVELSRKILHETNVALTPGVDFGKAAEGFLRFSYATALEDIQAGMERLEKFCSRHL